MGVSTGEGSKDTIYTLLLADYEVLTTQQYEDMEFMVRKLLEEYQKWDLKINLEKKLCTETKSFNIGRSERLHYRM